MWMRNLHFYFLVKTRGYRHWLCYSITFFAIIGMYIFSAAFLKETYPKNQLHSNKSMSISQFFNLINSTYGQYRILIAVLRAITTDFFHEHSDILLALPAELSETNVDTSKWSIQKGDLHAESCYQVLAEIVFYSDAVDLSQNCNAKVLLIGLGGGMVNGFLHFFFPKIDITVVEISAQMVYIAKKWFGMQFDDRHRIVIKDGVKFVKEQAEKGNG
ncbi:hypothetical protein ANCCEY_00682 [Ancylostoma ceylanicum]|uniref:PABS domain-containing protein n=1 Tax=Ancylostoma ceylanicum TaxID=53326 RepID=A0A0D6M863_9BILA|nr:hypothetical protein ANCCEY_00682 [Ancylostoma ceylanicum]